jgi:hypothetical protein
MSFVHLNHSMRCGDLAVRLIKQQLFNASAPNKIRPLKPTQTNQLMPKISCFQGAAIRRDLDH